jgi:hypothetical protein
VTAVADAKIVVEAAGRSVSVSNPGKVFFPRTGHTKLDLVNYYLAVADGALRGVSGRPMALKRFVNGAEAEPFFQKRAPSSRPDWITTAELRFPSGRTADEVVLSDAAGLAWVVNLGCIDLNLGVAGDAHLRADLALVVVHRRAPVGGGGGARDRAALPRTGDGEVVEGGAARGLRRLQPERQGPDRRLGLLGQAAAGRAGVDAADLG